MVKHVYALIFIVGIFSCKSKLEYKIVGTWQSIGNTDGIYFQFTEIFNNGLVEKNWQTYTKDKNPLGSGTYKLVKDTIWQIYEFPEFSGNKDSSFIIIRDYKNNEFFADSYVHSWDDLPTNRRSYKYSKTFKLQKITDRITSKPGSVSYSEEISVNNNSISKEGDMKYVFGVITVEYAGYSGKVTYKDIKLQKLMVTSIIEISNYSDEKKHRLLDVIRQNDLPDNGLGDSEKYLDIKIFEYADYQSASIARQKINYEGEMNVYQVF